MPVHEHVVIDDGSSEDLKAVVESFGDEKIRYFRYERVGRLSKLRNIALSKATGDFIAFIDSDDLWHRDKVKVHVETSLRTGAALTFSDCQYFDENGHVGPPVCARLDADADLFMEMMVRRQSLAYGTNLFFRRRPVDVPAVFNSRMVGGDIDFVLRMTATHRAVFIPEVFNFIRLHRDNMSAGRLMEALSQLEHNRTLRWLFEREKIGKSLCRRESASNLVKAGNALMFKGKVRLARRLILKGACMSPIPVHLRVLAKAYLKSRPEPSEAAHPG
jgi:glycosyltransferase involved in cell wall biosynthesis